MKKYFYELVYGQKFRTAKNDLFEYIKVGDDVCKGITPGHADFGELRTMDEERIVYVAPWVETAEE